MELRVAPGQAKKNFLEGSRTGAQLESREGIAGEQAAFLEDGDAVGEEFDFGQRVGSKKQGSIAAREELRFQEAAEIHGRDGVETSRRLIEQQHAWLMEQGAQQAEALNSAGRECADLTIERFVHVKLFGKLGDAQACRLPGEMVEAAEKEQILAAGEASVEAVVGAGMITEQAPNRARFARGVVARDAGDSAGRQKQGGQNAQKRGFAGPIGADQGQRFAVADFKRDAREGHSCRFFERLHKSAPAAARGRERLVESFDGNGARKHFQIYNLSVHRKQSDNLRVGKSAWRMPAIPGRL